MTKSVRHSIPDINFSVRQQLDDIYCLNLLQPLIGEGYLPFTNGAMRPAGLSFILNDILINSRKSIIEFGSGISTLLAGRLVKKNIVECKIVSIEHNESWFRTMEEIIDKEGLSDIVNIVYAPLTDCTLAIDSCLWYDITELNRVIHDLKFDMVIIDGPPAYMNSISMSRYPAYPFLMNNLSEKSIVILDDESRNGEQRIIKKWEDSYSIKFKIIFDSLAYYATGETFTAEIFKY